MDIMEFKAVFEWFLLRACFAALAALIVTVVCFKVYEHIGRLKAAAKRYGWPLVVLFIACSAWATYTAFPTSEEKQAYQEYLNGQSVTNSIWAGIYAPGNIPSSGNTTQSTEPTEANDSSQDNTNGAQTNTAADSETNDNEETEGGSNSGDRHSLTPEDFERGFVLTRIGTNEVHDFNAPEDALINPDWLAFGASRDWEYPSTDDWSFLLGTNEVERLRVFSYGEVMPIPSSTNTYFAPFKTLLGIVPEANWHLIDETNRPSQFWYHITSLNSLKLTWQNALYGRETNAPASFQMELWPNGNFTYRYDLSRAGLWNGESVTNVLVGAAYEGLAELVDISTLTNLTSLSFYRLDSSDTPGSDRDGDGLTIEDELFVYHTDPNFNDSDYDGFTDGDEVASGSNPASRDSDGDGLVDGSDPDPITETSLADTDGDGIPDTYENHWFGGTSAFNVATGRDETGFDLNGRRRRGRSRRPRSNLKPKWLRQTSSCHGNFLTPLPLIGRKEERILFGSAHSPSEEQARGSSSSSLPRRQMPPLGICSEWNLSGRRTRGIPAFLRLHLSEIVSAFRYPQMKFHTRSRSAYVRRARTRFTPPRPSISLPIFPNFVSKAGKK